MRHSAGAILSFLLIIVILSATLLGCTRTPREAGNEVVCTSFAAYDWVREILGETETLRARLLIADGSDLHSYQPTVADKVTLTEAALVVCIGGESDRWAAEMADGVRTVRLSELHGITLREADTEAEEHGHASGHVHDAHESGHDHEHSAFDEHLWLSPKNASVALLALCAELSALDGEHRAIYEKNAAAYCDALGALDAAFASAVENAPRRELLVADRFPFVYLTAEYGLVHCAAFSGCSTESQASFETVVRLAKQADEWGVSHLIVIEGSDRRLATSVIAATKDQSMTVLALDSMQAVSAARAATVTYLSVMEQNLQIIRAALS